jgi:hypothetical protein
LSHLGVFRARRMQFFRQNRDSKVTEVPSHAPGRGCGWSRKRATSAFSAPTAPLEGLRKRVG